MQRYHHSPLPSPTPRPCWNWPTKRTPPRPSAEELRDLREIIDTNPQFAQVLADPAISNEERGRLSHSVFDGRASTVVQHFLGLVNEKGRLEHPFLDRRRLRRICSISSRETSKWTSPSPTNSDDDQLESVRQRSARP